MTRSSEQTRVTSLPFLGGVDLLRARFVNQTFSKHFHEGFAVGCLEQGALRFRYRGETVVAARGQVNLVVPGEVHDGHAADEQGWAYRMFYLSPEALMEAARALMPRPSLPHFRAGVLDDPRFAACLGRTHQLLESADISLLEKETRLLWLLTNWISRHADQNGSWPDQGKDHRAVGRAMEIIRARFAEDLPLSALSREAGLSSFHLVRVFEKQLGITPHAFLTQVRVDQVRRLLRGSARMVDIAAACGFSDQSHMTRLFKRQTGFTPGKYRKIVQNV